MADQRLVEYIRKYRGAYSTGELRKALIDQGYNPVDVDEAMKPSASAAQVPEKGGSHLKIIVLIAVLAAISVVAIYLLLPMLMWSQIEPYWEDIVKNSLEITDSFCTGDGIGAIFVRNTGTDDIRTSEITIKDGSDDSTLRRDDYTWTDEDGTRQITRISAGEQARLTTPCNEGECSYSIVIGGKSKKATYYC